MSIFSTLDIAASGMTAQRLRQDVIANNIANANTTRTPEGTPFRRHLVVFEPRPTPRTPQVKSPGLPYDPLPYSGVRVSAVIQDRSDFKLVYDPAHPDADSNGYVRYPNVDPIVEMVDLIEASRSYEANLSVFETAKQLVMRTLAMGR